MMTGQNQIRSTVLGLAAIALCVLGIRSIQPKLAQQVHTVKKAKGTKLVKRDDTPLVPPPAQLRAMTFGYKTVVADLFWANLVLEYGLHWQEKRAFPDINRYIDAVIALEPNHPILYQFVDTMVVFTPTGAGEEEARTARRYLELGAKERPYDAELWLRYGQFLAFLAPSFLKDEAEIERWRIEGANVIVHAVELGADADRSLAALTILRKAGDRKSARANIERLFAVTDDPETRQQLLFKLQQLGETMMESDAAVSIVEREWRGRYPFLSRSAVMLIGPHRSAAACAGPGAHSLKDCPLDWTAAIGGDQPFGR